MMVLEKRGVIVELKGKKIGEVRPSNVRLGF